jgi:secreted Zn-dependent insulinase-like peptidase
LRTINKLGYVAFCFNGNNENVGSFQVLVQSEAFDGRYVYNKISEFLEDHVFSSVLNQTNLTQFSQFIEDQKTVLKSVLKRKEPTLGQRTSHLWNKIKYGQLTFDLLEQEVQLLDSNLINATSVVNFYREYVLDPATYRKMIIIVNGKDRDFEPDTTYPLDYAHLPDSYPPPTDSS